MLGKPLVPPGGKDVNYIDEWKAAGLETGAEKAEMGNRTNEPDYGGALDREIVLTNHSVILDVK